MQSGLMFPRSLSRGDTRDTLVHIAMTQNYCTSHKTKPYPVYTYVAVLTNQTSFILNANIIINVQTPDSTPNKYLSKPTKQVR